MKKHIALIIVLMSTIIIHPTHLEAITNAQENEANNTLIASFRQKLKTFTRKMSAYKRCIFGECEAQELQELQQFGKGLAYTFALIILSGLIVGGVSYLKANDLLVAAAKYNNADGVRSALKLGADVNAHNKFGQTAAMFAAFNGNAAMLKSFTDLGANLEHKDDDGRTARDYYQQFRTRTGLEPIIWD